MEFYGHHGVAPEERTVGHRFQATVTVEIDAPIPASDQIADTIDYGRLADIVIEVGTGESHKTLEFLAGTVGNKVLDRFPTAVSVEVSLEKLLPPLPYVVQSACVGVKMKRDLSDL